MPNPNINRRLSAGGSAGSSSFDLNTGLISYWSFDVDFSDAVGGNTLTAPNGGVAIQGNGIIADCAGLNASVAGSVLTHADNASLGAGSGVSFSMSIWTTYDSGHPDSLLIGKWDGTNNDYALRLQGSDNYWLFVVTNLAGAQIEVDTGILASSLGNVGQTKWYHIAAGYDDSVQAIWIQINGGLRRWNSCVGVQRSSAPFVIGNIGTSGSTPLGGAVDECAFWHRSLSPDEINLVYNGGLANQYPFSGTVSPGSAITRGQDWANRVVLNGGAAPSQNAVNAVNDLANGLITDGTAGALLEAIPIVPDSLIAATTPIFNLYGNDPWTNNGFISGDLTVNGLAGDAVAKFLDSGLIPGQTASKSLASVLTSTSAGLIAYVYDNSPSSSNVIIGCNGSVANSSFLFVTSEVGATLGEFDCWKQINGGQDAVVFPKPAAGGYFCGSRTAANAASVFFANTATAHGSIGTPATVAQSGAIESTFGLYGFATNLLGTASRFSSCRLSFLAVLRYGVSAAQSQKIFNRLQAFRTALGGGFV